MRLSNPLEYLNRYRQKRLERHGTVLFDVLSERNALGVFHDDIRQIAIATVIEYRDDIRVMQDAQAARFALETPNRIFVVDQIGIENFDANVASQFRLLGQVDDAHPAFANATNDLVATREAFPLEIVERAPSSLFPTRILTLYKRHTRLHFRRLLSRLTPSRRYTP